MTPTRALPCPTLSITRRILWPAPGLRIGPTSTAPSSFPPASPTSELRHRYTVAAPASGSIFLDDVFFRQVPPPSATNWTTLVPFRSSWRYSTNSPPSNWVTSNFNDSSWPLGTAKFGNGSGPTNIVTRLPQWLSAYYFPRKFVVTSTDLEELLLSATCTDASVAAIYPLRIFLNGTEIETFIDAVTMQGKETRYFDLLPFAHLLRPGTNVIAILLGNTWSDYDDLAFDISLKAVPYHPILPRLNFQHSGSSGPAISVETPRGSVWSLRSCDEMSTGPWQPMLNFTNTAGGLQTFQDTGQNGRPLPASVARRFYRLTPY
jgi:hypothetical protein